MKPLTGRLEYCRMEGCYNTVHYEDAPKFYPFCKKHKSANKSYYELKKQKRELELLYKELYGALKDNNK